MAVEHKLRRGQYPIFARGCLCRRVKGVANGKVFSLAAPPLHPDIEMAVIPDVGEHTDDIRAEFGLILCP